MDIIFDVKQKSCTGIHCGGCKIDHGAPRWARVTHEDTGESYSIPIYEDTQCKSDFVSPTIVTLLGLEKRCLEPPKPFVVSNGEKHLVTEEVSLTLTGTYRSAIPINCLVAANGYPLHAVVVGSEFIRGVGHIHDLFEAKSDDQPQLVAVAYEQSVCTEV